MTARSVREAVPAGVTRSLESSPTTLLLVDFVNPMEFPTAKRLEAPALAAARAASELKRAMRRRGARAVYANDNYGVWQSSFEALIDRCRAAGGAPADMVERLAPKPGDATILKPRHSAFFLTPLDLLLEHLGVRTLVIVGLATDRCVLATAMDAHVRGYRLRVPQNCVAAETPRRHREAIRYMAEVLRADVRPFALSAAGRTPATRPRARSAR